MMMTPDPLAAIRSGYIAAALWTSFAGDPLGADRDVSLLDLGMTRDDLAPETVAQVDADIAAFIAATSDADRATWDEEYSEERVGHDLWLTRNHHGAGFWSRPDHRDPADLHDVARRLTDAAHALGEVDWYLGDRDMLDVVKVYQG